MAIFPPNLASESQEAERLKAVYALEILDTPEEPEYDELVRLAAEICGTPISTVTIVDADRQWFKAAIGMDTRETPREVSFCAQAMWQPDLFIVENAAIDAHFRSYANVTKPPEIRFYAGVPLEANGLPIGTLCVIDTVPRKLTESQQNALRILGRQVKARIELRAQKTHLEQALQLNDQLNAELRSRNELFTGFMNHGPFVSYIKDAQGRMLYYNRQMARHFSVSEEAWIGRSNEEIWPAEVATELRRNDDKVLAAGAPIEVTETICGGDGALTQWRSYKFPFHSANGKLLLAGISLDITDQLRRQAELDTALEEKLQLAQNLENTTQLFQTFVHHNPNLCFFKSSDGRYLGYNRRFAEHYGIGEQAWIGNRDTDVRSQAEAADERQLDREVLAQNEVHESIYQLRDSSGNEVWHKTFRFPIHLPSGDSILACVALDITEEIRKERALAEANLRLEQLATTDSLTGLANRRTFEQRLATDFALSRRGSLALCVLVLDIDNFKKRNDTHGHAAGDEALRVLAAVLKQNMRATDLAARIGGEEFAILLSATEENGAARLAERLQAEIRNIVCSSGPITVSIGIAGLHRDTAGWEQMLSEADYAMYQAKRAGKDRLQLFSTSAKIDAAKTDSAKRDSAKTDSGIAAPALPGAVEPGTVNSNRASAERRPSPGQGAGA